MTSMSWPTEELATCRWCLAVIHRSRHLGWLHLHEGLYLCRSPLPGAPPRSMAAPLPATGVVAHLARLLTRNPTRPASCGTRAAWRGGA
jgi:hypothetical protein